MKEDRLVIIEEKGLVKAIKIAYRHGGYTLLKQCKAQGGSNPLAYA